jgi:hypothetical protein
MKQGEMLEHEIQGYDDDVKCMKNEACRLSQNYFVYEDLILVPIIISSTIGIRVGFFINNLTTGRWISSTYGL